MSRASLQRLFEPRSVAVVGASSTKGKAGYFLFRNILEGGYQGRVYPVNPNSRKTLGCKTYHSVREIPEAVDLAFLIVPNPLVKPALLECVEKKVKSVAIVTAGFGEVGLEGMKAQRELEEIVRSSGIRALGPNSVGFINSEQKLIASFVPFRQWPKGSISIGAQTGVFAGAYADELSERRTQRIGFSKSICFGNKIDVDETDFLHYTGGDKATRVVALHLESIKRPRQFLAAAAHVKQTKPIVVLKTGRSEEGARAAASHTGALAASDRVVDAALRQYGVVRAETFDDFMGIAKAFTCQPLPRGRRVGVVTFSGALAVMALDEMQGAGLELAQFAESTVAAISALLPEWQPAQNPADVWMALARGSREAHEQILGAVLADPQVDLLLCILLPIPNADFPDVKATFRQLKAKYPDKPIFLVMQGGRVKQRWLEDIESLDIPVYSEPRPAVAAMKAVCFYAERRTRPCADPLWKPAETSR